MSTIPFSVEGHSVSATQFLGKTRQFNFTIDEPEALGGKDEAPNPVEFILAGFAGCINVVGHLVAKELGFEIDNLTIRIVGDINPNKFLGVSNNERAGFKSIQLELVPETKVGFKLLGEWLRIVEERCPVKDNLSNTTPIQLSLVKEYQ